ncbi:hypothetical protein SEA_WARREN_10 [Microbacterium phage Warren]|nr:hypothetical protein SEA_WARREN_10 [Microbacterium phage Warren]
MRVGGTRYDVRMIETFEQARDAVHHEMSLLIDDPATLVVARHGFEDEHGWMIQWGVTTVGHSGRVAVDEPLPRAATFVDRLTGFVSLTSAEAERERIAAMSRVSA